MVYQKDFQKILQSKPHIILGKNGITDEFINHVTTLLSKFRIIKIKALKSVANKTNIKEIANKVADMTNSHLMDLRGKIFILSKYPIKKKIN
jgi:RNA-binding protein